MDRRSHPVGSRRVGDGVGEDLTLLGDERTRVPDRRRLEGREIIEREDVGLVSGAERAEMKEVVVLGAVDRGHHERVLDGDARRDGKSHAIVDVPEIADRVGFAVVGTERDAVGSVLEHAGYQRRQVLRRRTLANERPHPLASLLVHLVELGRLVIGLDACGEVRVELTPGDAGRVAVDRGDGRPRRSSLGTRGHRRSPRESS